MENEVDKFWKKIIKSSGIPKEFFINKVEERKRKLRKLDECRKKENSNSNEEIKNS